MIVVGTYRSQNPKQPFIDRWFQKIFASQTSRGLNTYQCYGPRFPLRLLKQRPEMHFKMIVDVGTCTKVYQALTCLNVHLPEHFGISVGLHVRPVTPCNRPDTGSACPLGLHTSTLRKCRARKRLEGSTARRPDGALLAGRHADDERLGGQFFRAAPDVCLFVCIFT